MAFSLRIIPTCVASSPTMVLKATHSGRISRSRDIPSADMTTRYVPEEEEENNYAVVITAAAMT